MTVGELRKIIEDIPDDHPVLVVKNFGEFGCDVKNAFTGVARANGQYPFLMLSPFDGDRPYRCDRVYAENT